MCGIWVEVHIVICSPVGSTSTERGSMNAGISRCWISSRSITMPSGAGLLDRLVDVAAGAGVALSNCQKALLLVPRSGCASTSSFSASLMSRTAGSSSYSMSTSSAASRASAALRATTTATASPAKVTRSIANGGCVGAFWSAVIGQALIITPIESSSFLPSKTS